ERWLDENGREFRPYTHYCVGGNTKFWGSVLYRLRREDFEEVRHADGVSPAWPIGYDTLAPYYERAERLYHVRGQHGIDPTEVPRGPFPYAPVPHAAVMDGIVCDLRRIGLHPSPLPLGVMRLGETDGCVLCNTCNSFPCKVGAKRDAAAERHAVDARVRAPADHQRPRLEGGSRRSGAPWRDHSGGSAGHCRLVRRGELGRAAAAVGERPASRRPRQLVGARRPPLHGAPRDDDAGVSPVQAERDGLPED